MCELDVVHGLPDDCQCAEVEDLFNRFGKVDYVFIPPRNLRRTEPGFIKFWSPEHAKAALHASQSGAVTLHNNRLHCEYHRSKAARPMQVDGGSTSSTRPLDPPPPPANPAWAQNAAWGNMQPLAEVEEFIRLHSLGPRAEQELRSLPLETQLGLTRKRYTPDIRSMDGMIIRLSRQAKGEESRPFRSTHVRGGGKGSQGVRRGRAGKRISPEEHQKMLERFFQINNLDDSCIQAFRDSPQPVQAAVLETCPDLQIKPTNDGRTLNPSAVAMFKLGKARERLQNQGIRLKEGHGREAASPNWRPRTQRGSGSENERSRSRSYRSRSADSYSPRSQAQDGEDGAAPEGVDIVGADPQGDRGRRARRSVSLSRSDSRSNGESKGDARRVVVAQGEDKEEDPNISSLLQISSLPDLSVKGKGACKYLADLFNPTVKTLPDYNKELGGDAVQKAWEASGKAGIVYMQLQNAALAESAARTMHGLHFLESTLKVQAVPKAEADAVLHAAP